MLFVAGGLLQESACRAADPLTVRIGGADSAAPVVVAHAAPAHQQSRAYNTGFDGEGHAVPAREQSAFKRPSPESLQFPAWDSTRSVPRSSVFDKVLSTSRDRAVTSPREQNAGGSLAARSVSQLASPATETTRRQNPVESARRSPAPARQEAFSADAGRGSAESGGAPFARVPLVPAVPRLTQATMLKLDSVQAGCFGAGLLMCLLFQVAIVVVLLKQRQQSLQMPAILPAYEGLMPFGGRPTAGPGSAVDRPTAVVDFETNPGLWEDTGPSIGQKWQLEEDTFRQQEAAIVEELVLQNVTWARELTQS
jgi:hypothetical protein